MLFTNPSTAARENMAKNRGQPGVWFAHLADYREPQPKPRVRLAKALSIARRNQPNRSMATLAGFEPISDQGKSRPESKPWCWKDWENEADECWDDVALTPARVRTEKAAENAKRFAEQKNTWHDFEGNLRYQPTPRQPRLGPGEEVQVSREL
ncbi:unnamed protein product [Protopolystoma xenopodis]|uniref:Uncharacterized protein n=1 Tax=Protopolystoma xenopodis TaxID=117903 RepID=A0A3S4ZTC2_9PLAT|nr:unnamed protein product [Protopolystoma xenopodis]